MPIYSPIIPSDNRISPPIPHKDITILVQPATVLPNAQTTKKYINIIMLTENTNTPSVVIILIGFTLHDVIPSTAKDSIFLSGYLDSPAKRSWRS